MKLPEAPQPFNIINLPFIMSRKFSSKPSEPQLSYFELQSQMGISKHGGSLRESTGLIKIRGEEHMLGFPKGSIHNLTYLFNQYDN